MAKKLENYTDDELTEALAKVDGDMAALRDKKVELAGERERRLNTAEADRVLDRLSDSQKQALLQRLAPQGIESTAAVNGQASGWQ